MKKIKIYCDGGSRGNPGPAASAIVVTKSGKTVFEKSKYLGKQTNNFAEYWSVIMAHSFLVKNKKKLVGFGVEMQLDSELVAKQLNGEYRIKSDSIKPLYQKAKKLEDQFGEKVKYLWSPRVNNKRADKLVNQELDKARHNT